MIIFIFGALFITLANADPLAKCEGSKAKTCEKCMHVDPDCVWITTKDYNGTRCTYIEPGKENEHSEVQVENNHHTASHIIKDEPFKLPSASETDTPATQIRPQNIRLWLRENDSINVTIRYKALKNYPLDIYYLVDSTFSMMKHIDELSSLGEVLSTELQSITDNYKIASGYFNDKVAMPYYAMAENKLADPCRNTSGDRICTIGSNFEHAKNFSTNTTDFVEQFKKENFKFTANLDDPEGGLDAIMQILLCDNFGWRNHSRKMIVLATDGLLHTAGDGLLGGLIKRTPKECKMKWIEDDRLVYDGLSNDYPSLEEVARQLKKNKVRLIFAIQENAELRNADYYNRIKDQLNQASFLIIKENATDNFKNVIKEGFTDIVQNVEFMVEDLPDYLEVVSETTCDSKPLNQSWLCTDVRLETEYSFNLNFKLTELPSKNQDVIRIVEKNIREVIEIEINYPERCTCDGELILEDNVVHGRHSCGIKICAAPWVGDDCMDECNPSIAKYSNATECRKPNVECCNAGNFDLATCKCICDQRRGGEHCEFECPINRGKVCSDNGKCADGKCDCKPNYTGDDCGCYSSSDICTRNNKVCEGHGVCKCGECECKNIGDIKYSGKFCQFCDGCNNCRYNDVVTMHARGRTIDGNAYDIAKIEESDDEHHCQVEYSPNSTHTCKIFYKYDFEVVEIPKITYYLKCEEEPNQFIAMGMVAWPYVVAVLIGCLSALLVWKYKAMREDGRKIAAFKEATLLETKYENQLYRSPITTFKNPAAAVGNHI